MTAINGCHGAPKQLLSCCSCPEIVQNPSSSSPTAKTSVQVAVERPITSPLPPMAVPSSLPPMASVDGKAPPKAVRRTPPVCPSPLPRPEPPSPPTAELSAAVRRTAAVVPNRAQWHDLVPSFKPLLTRRSSSHCQSCERCPKSAAHCHSNAVPSPPSFVCSRPSHFFVRTLSEDDLSGRSLNINAELFADAERS